MSNSSNYLISRYQVAEKLHNSSPYKPIIAACAVVCEYLDSGKNKKHKAFSVDLLYRISEVLDVPAEEHVPKYPSKIIEVLKKHGKGISSERAGEHFLLVKAELEAMLSDYVGDPKNRFTRNNSGFASLCCVLIEKHQLRLPQDIIVKIVAGANMSSDDKKRTLSTVVPETGLKALRKMGGFFSEKTASLDTGPSTLVSPTI